MIDKGLQVKDAINKGLVLILLADELRIEPLAEQLSNLGNVNVSIGLTVQLIDILLLVFGIGNNLLKPLDVLGLCLAGLHISQHKGLGNFGFGRRNIF